MSAADFSDLGFAVRDYVVAAIGAADPVHQIGPGDQIGAAYDTAGKLAGTDSPAEGVLADGHAVLLGSGNGFGDFQNFKV